MRSSIFALALLVLALSSWHCDAQVAFVGGKKSLRYVGINGETGTVSIPSLDTSKMPVASLAALPSDHSLIIADAANSVLYKAAVNSEGELVAESWAGISGGPGFTDGIGNLGTFTFPKEIATLESGDIVVADMGNFAIRKVSPEAEVTTIAGGVRGGADGTGTDAQFRSPGSLAVVPGTSTVLVADATNFAIRSVDVDSGEVTTVAGWMDAALGRGTTDGVGTDARFDYPQSIAVSPDGTLAVVADLLTVRLIQLSDYTVTTVSGTPSDVIYGDAVARPTAVSWKNDNTILFTQQCNTGAVVRAVTLSDSLTGTTALVSGSDANGCAPGTQMTWPIHSDTPMLIASDSGALVTELVNAVAPDEIKPVISAAGWSFDASDPTNDKINFYFMQSWDQKEIAFPATANAVGFTVGDLNKISVTMNGTIGNVFLRVYTTLTGSNDAASWYHSSWYVPAATVGFTAEEPYSTVFEVDLSDGSNYDTGSSSKTNVPIGSSLDDQILAVSIQTNSADDTYDFTMTNFTMEFEQRSVTVELKETSTSGGVAVDGGQDDAMFEETWSLNHITIACDAFFAPHETVVFSDPCTTFLPQGFSSTGIDGSSITLVADSAPIFLGDITLSGASSITCANYSVYVDTIVISGESTIQIYIQSTNPAGLVVSESFTVTSGTIILEVDSAFVWSAGETILVVQFEDTLSNSTGQFTSVVLISSSSSRRRSRALLSTASVDCSIENGGCAATLGGGDDDDGLASSAVVAIIVVGGLFVVLALALGYAVLVNKKEGANKAAQYQNQGTPYGQESSSVLSSTVGFSSSSPLSTSSFYSSSSAV